MVHRRGDFRHPGSAHGRLKPARANVSVGAFGALIRHTSVRPGDRERVASGSPACSRELKGGEKGEPRSEQFSSTRSRTCAGRSVATGGAPCNRGTGGLWTPG